MRPTAVEVYQDGYNPRAVRERAGSWTGFVASMEDLTTEQRRVVETHGAFINELDTTEMVKSYKMLVLLAMLNADKCSGSITIDELAEEVERLANRTAKAGADLGPALADSKTLLRLLEQHPIAAWVGGKGTGGVSYFVYTDGRFSTTFETNQEIAPALQELVRELTEWRLTAHLDRVQTQKAGHSTLKVSHAAGGQPILFLPAEPERSDLPTGWTDIHIGDAVYSANFVKVAVNVIRGPGDEENQLPKILRGWFGQDAGASVHVIRLLLRGAEMSGI